MPADRATLVKLVHVGARQLFGADQDARRDWQRQRTGKASCADMTPAQLEVLVTELRRRGALQPRRRPAHRPESRKIWALWAQLKLMGAVGDGSPRALGRWLQRQHGKHHPDWLAPDEAQRAIEALKAWLARAKTKALREGAQTQTGRDHAD
jgi:phage gp16-like protein